MNSNIAFLDWLKNRLIYKHRYAVDDSVLEKIEVIKQELGPKRINITDDQLDSIIVKYYADFYLDYADDIKIGFTNDERNKLRSTIRSILEDVNKLTY